MGTTIPPERDFRFATTGISFKTSLGWITLEATPKGLKEVRFGKFDNIDASSSLLERVKSDILKYLQGRAVIFSYPIDVSFTTFQTKIFNELIKISYGTTISYKELARLADTSPRACGRILGSNPFPIIIPCHRVICANGELGGYSGGLYWKKELLKLENSNRNGLTLLN